MDTHELYEEFLDECYPPMQLYYMGGIIEVAYSQGLRKIDPIMYNEGLRDYEDHLEEEKN